MPKTLLIGSNNPGKARELAELLEGLPWEVKSLRDFPPAPEPEESGTTFEENALLKARYFCERYQVAVVADDSGLEVDALNGAPGVYSARYAGEPADHAKNNEKLLDALAETPWHERTARFVCCAVFLAPDTEPHIEYGTVEGHIAMECFGGQGFGYDPLFVPEGHDRTFGEMENAEKHRMSHRGRALQKIRAYLKAQA